MESRISSEAIGLKRTMQSAETATMTDTVLPDLGAPNRPPERPSLRPSRTVLLIAGIAVIVGVAVGGYELLKPGPAVPVATPGPAAITVFPSSPASPPATVARGSLPALVNATFANARRQGSVRVVNQYRSPKHGVVTYEQVDGLTSGVQRITAFGGWVTVRVIGSNTFVTGDQRGLTKYMSLSASVARQIVGHWLNLVPSDSAYAAVTEAVTLPSLLDEVSITGVMRRVPARTLGGQRVFGVRGYPSGHGQAHNKPAIVWISTARHLPVEFDLTAKGTTERVRFTHWGAAVNVPVPPNPLHVIQQPSTTT